VKCLIGFTRKRPKKALKRVGPAKKKGFYRVKRVRERRGDAIPLYS